MDKNKVEEVRKFVEENKRWPTTKEVRMYGICKSARTYFNPNRAKNSYRLEESEAKEIIKILEPYKTGGRIYVKRFKNFVEKNKRLPNSNIPEERVVYFTYCSAILFPEYRQGPYVKLEKQEVDEILTIAKGYKKAKENRVEKFKKFLNTKKRLPTVKDRVYRKIYKSAKNYLTYNLNYYKLDKEEADKILELAKPYEEEKSYVKEFEKFIRKYNRLPKKTNGEYRVYRAYQTALDFPEYNHGKHVKLTDEEVEEIKKLIKEVI